MTDPTENDTDSGSLQIPESHPLHGKEQLLDTHAGHIKAYAEVLDESDPDEVNALLVVMATDDTTDTLPTIAPHVSSEMHNFLLLSAHIHYVSQQEGLPPKDIAKHAVHMIRSDQPIVNR